MKNKFKYILLIVLFFVLFCGDVFAQAMPINKMTVSIEPLHKEDKEDVLTPITVTFNQSKRTLRVFWNSLVKVLDDQAEYHTYRVKASRGIIETNNFVGKRALLLPGMWGNGYIRSETALPLWVDPEILNLKGRKTMPLNVGILNSNNQLLKAANDEVFEKVNFFQNLYNQYVSGFNVRTDLKLKKTQVKDLEIFAKEFFFVKRIAKTKAKIKVNGVNEEYPVILIGNDYFVLTVIDDPLNPMVMHFKLNANKAPDVFKEPFEEMAKLFEFSVSEVTY